MQDDKEKISKRNAFCCYYAVLGNAAEAALKAGFSSKSALSEGLKALNSVCCRRKISRYRDALSDSGNVMAGLKRLAFGSCTDAVRLVFAEELPPPDVISELDLFNVSEIKRDKNGGVEVKLFDRLKALEKLYELETAFSDRSKADDLMSALTSSAEEGDIVEDQ